MSVVQYVPVLMIDGIYSSVHCLYKPPSIYTQPFEAKDHSKLHRTLHCGLGKTDEGVVIGFIDAGGDQYHEIPHALQDTVYNSIDLQKIEAKGNMWTRNGVTAQWVPDGVLERKRQHKEMYDMSKEHYQKWWNQNYLTVKGTGKWRLRHGFDVMRRQYLSGGLMQSVKGMFKFPKAFQWFAQVVAQHDRENGIVAEKSDKTSDKEKETGKRKKDADELKEEVVNESNEKEEESNEEEASSSSESSEESSKEEPVVKNTKKTKLNK